MASNTKRQFTKGLLNSQSNNPYQDPTFLTFTLMFDVTSPLFNTGVAHKALVEQYKEPKRADKLLKFIDTLILINKEMPWYFTSITGVDRVFDINMTEPYWGGKEAKLVIECDESINLAITGLMDLYREAVYNLSGWTQVLPENYKRFNLYVIVSEVRDIQNSRKNKQGNDVAINTDITASNKPYFMFKFGKCHFDITSAKETFETLTSKDPASPKPKITINYETIEKVDAKYLNGIIMDESVEDNIGVGKETPNPSFIERGADALNDAMNTAMDGIKNFNPKNELMRPNNVYGSIFEKAFQNAVNDIDSIAGGIGNIPENLFKTGVVSTTAGINSILKSAKANIFGVKSGSTLGTALRQGSVNSILPTITNAVNKKNNLGNVNN